MTDKIKSSENRRILQIAIPSIISNITVPLLGLIDVTIVGHLGSPAYIGAIAVGGMLFNIIYWIFGFLRMGTSGMTSQAYGQHDLNEIPRLLLRSVGVGLFIALCLLILQPQTRNQQVQFRELGTGIGTTKVSDPQTSWVCFRFLRASMQIHGDAVRHLWLPSAPSDRGHKMLCGDVMCGDHVES